MAKTKTDTSGNLRPLTKGSQRAREMASIGGKACFAKMREEHNLKQRLEKAHRIFTKMMAKGKSIEEAKNIQELGCVEYQTFLLATCTSVDHRVQMSAIKEIYDRMEGKVIQKTELTGKDGQALQINTYTQEELKTQANDLFFKKDK